MKTNKKVVKARSAKTTKTKEARSAKTTEKKTPKKKWYIKEEQVTTQCWEYEVEAETEKEAKRMVRDGEVDAYNYYTDIVDDSDSDSPIEIVDIYEIDDDGE
jgi:membrane-bound lytic murein transglycosylase